MQKREAAVSTGKFDKKNTKPKIGRYASAQGIKLANENTRQKTFKAKVLGVLRVASVTVILSYYFSMLKLFFLCGKLQHEIWQTLSTSLCSFFFLEILVSCYASLSLVFFHFCASKASKTLSTLAPRICEAKGYQVVGTTL